MKKKFVLIVVLIVLLFLLGMSTGLIGVHFAQDPSVLSQYWTIVLSAVFGSVGGEFLKLILKRTPD